MTVGEIGWFTAGFHAAAFSRRFERMVRTFELDLNAAQQPFQGPVRQGGAGLALAADPQVLILDEPTSGLDLLVRARVPGQHGRAWPPRDAPSSSPATRSPRSSASPATSRSSPRPAAARRAAGRAAPPDRSPAAALREAPPRRRPLWAPSCSATAAASSGRPSCRTRRRRGGSAAGGRGDSRHGMSALGLEEIYCALLNRKAER